MSARTDISAAQPALLAAARAVRDNAHAPYSRFAVGAAVLDELGRIHAGCNVENAAYPQGWCAIKSSTSFTAFSFPPITMVLKPIIRL